MVKDKKITGLSQDMKTTGHSSALDNVRTIYRGNNWKIEISKKQLQ